MGSYCLRSKIDVWRGNAKFIQNYNIRYTNEQLINIIYHTLDKIDSLLECDEEMCVITPIPACYYDYLLYFAATVNNKKYLQLKFTKVDNRIIYSHSFRVSARKKSILLIKNI